MEKKQFAYLRFKPIENPDKRLISEVLSCPFDYIFTPTASQEEVYTKFKPVSDDLKLGKNSCIVVAGEKNSGRKYSIFGKALTQNGIISKIAEEVLQVTMENTYELYFAECDIKETSASGRNTRSRVRFESNLSEIIEKLIGKKSNAAVYKLIFCNCKTGKESQLTVILLPDSQKYMQGISSYIEGNRVNPISVLLESFAPFSNKLFFLFTCREEKQALHKIKEVFFSKTSALDSQTTENTEKTPLNELDQLRDQNTQLQEKIKELTENLFNAEKKAYEYYECYHKTLLLINKDSAQNVFLNSQNEGLIRQIRKETNILQGLESKYQSLFEACTRSHESTHIEFDTCLDSLLTSENPELNATDTLNIGINQIKLSLMPDPMMFSPYSSEIKKALEGNTELNKEIQILQLKNQLIEASVINANLSRMLSSFDWKLAMVKYRYEMKRLLAKQQHDRIKSLEDILEHLNISSQYLKNIANSDRKQIEKLFDKYCYKAITDSQRIVSEYKRIIQNVEVKVTESHRKEAQKWMELLQEHKENYETELNRKQEEVIRLNELLGKWCNKFMELQESLTVSEKPLSIVFYNEIQEIIHSTIHKPLPRSPSKQLTPKAKPQSYAQKFGVISGDVQPAN